MKKILLLLPALLLTLFIYQSADSQVYFHEEFDGSLGDWTTIGIEINLPSQYDYDWENNVWEWDADGIPDSRYRILDTIDSETRYNGTAILDVVGIHRKETGGVPGRPYPAVHSELISPVIDISNGNKIMVEFTHVLAELNDYDRDDNLDRANIAYRIDGGEWSQPFPMPDIEPNGPDTSRVTSFYVAKAENANTLQWKFIFYSDFYYWVVDDFKVFEAEEFSDLEISNPFVTPFVYGQPSISVTRDTMAFFFDLKEHGSVSNDSTLVSVTVTKNDDGELIYHDQRYVPQLVLGLEGGRRDSLINRWIPDLLEPGKYIITYKTENAVFDDLNKDDNEISYEFEVTDNLFKMDDGISGSRGIERNSDYAFSVGMMYKLPGEVEGEYAWDKVYTAYDTTGSFDVTDYGYTLSVLKMNSKICRDSRLFNRNGPSPVTNDQFELLGSTYISFLDYPAGELLELIIEDIDTGEELEIEKRKITPGECYFFFVQLPDNSFNSGIATDNRPYSPDIEQAGRYRPILHDTDGDRYWTGGWNGETVPVLRANITMITSNDEEKLPEESLSIYPNPSKDQINAEISLEQISDVTVVIADMQGKVHSISVERGVQESKISRDISNLSPGTYIFRIVTANGARYVKFVKL